MSARPLEGYPALVVAIDPDEVLLVVADRTGKRQTLDMANVLDRHIRPGWVQTVHAAQGATADIYTDSRADLINALGVRDGAQVGAPDGMTKGNIDVDFSLYGSFQYEVEH